MYSNIMVVGIETFLFFFFHIDSLNCMTLFLIFAFRISSTYSTCFVRKHHKSRISKGFPEGLIYFFFDYMFAFVVFYLWPKYQNCIANIFCYGIIEFCVPLLESKGIFGSSGTFSIYVKVFFCFILNNFLFERYNNLKWCQ